MSRLRFWFYAWSTTISAMFFAMLVALGCAGSVTPAQEAAIEKGSCIILDTTAGAVGGPVAEELVTIACDQLGAWVLAKLEAGAPPAPTPSPAPLKAMKVTSAQCVAAGLCAPKLVDAGVGG